MSAWKFAFSLSVVSVCKGWNLFAFWYSFRNKSESSNTTADQKFEDVKAFNYKNYHYHSHHKFSIVCNIFILNSYTSLVSSCWFLLWWLKRNWSNFYNNPSWAHRESGAHYLPNEHLMAAELIGAVMRYWIMIHLWNEPEHIFVTDILTIQIQYSPTNTIYT